MTSEDIRRSIEILDNVLAEFDEVDDETWRESANHDVILRRRSVTDLDCSSSSFSSCSARSSFDSYRPFTIDGASCPSPSQWRKYTPPPVPQRSPSTHLSPTERNHRHSCLVLPSTGEDINKRPSPKSGCKTNVPISDMEQQVIRSNTKSEECNWSSSEDVFEDNLPKTTIAMDSSGRKFLSSDSGIDSLLVAEDSNLSDVLKQTSASDSNLYWTQPPLDPALERIRKLDIQFAKVKLLLKTHKIMVLDYSPPNFVPARPLQDAHAIRDLPKFLPTDTLSRPEFGLFCAMEDDLDPGHKDLLTSTPKRDRVHLSTFSQSASSLGYVSSQSDQDLSLSIGESRIVPVDTLNKSQTLPMGVRLVAPLSYVSTDCDRLVSSQLPGVPVYRHIDHFRSSSAPPLKPLQQKKGLFGMSRKERRGKNEDGISVKSNTSADDGVCFTKVSPIDGTTSSKNRKEFREMDSPWEDKSKRKSVWKSILRKK